MARSNQRRFTSRARRPNRGWTSSGAQTGFVTAAANTVTFVSSLAPSNPGIDVTVLRVVGQLSIASDQTGASEEQIGAMGMILVTDSAVAIGVTAMPDPVVDADDDGWFLYQSFSQQSALNTIGLGSVQYHFDSKAKRIVDGVGVNIAVMLTNSHGTQGLLFSLQFRMLSQIRGTS